MSSSPGAALKVYRTSLGLVAASLLLLPIPYINIAGALLFLGAGLASLIGLGLFLSAAPSGCGLGARLGIVVALMTAGVFLIFQSTGRWSRDTPLMVMGMLCLMVGGAVFHLFWMKVAEAVNAWRIADSFKVPLVVGVVGSVSAMVLTIAEAPAAVQLLVTGTSSLVSFITFWSALSGLQNVLTYGVPGEED